MKFWIRIALGIAAASAVIPGGVVSHAQQGAAPTQTPPPITDGRLIDPAPNLPRGAAVPTNWLTDDQFMRWPYPAGDRAYNDLDGFRIKGLVNEITAISRKSRDDGHQYCGRITGTSYEKMTNEWVAAQFRRIGLEQVRIQEQDLPPQWFPTSWDMIATGGGKTVPIATAFPLFNSVGGRVVVKVMGPWKSGGSR